MKKKYFHVFLSLLLSLGLIFSSGIVMPAFAAEITDDLVSEFSIVLYDNDGNTIEIPDGSTVEVDVEEINAAKLSFILIRPDDVVLQPGDTYTLPLPPYFDISTTDIPIVVDGIQVATYSIVGGELIITFGAAVEHFDQVAMYVDITGAFDTEIFEEETEVTYEVPYAEGGSYTGTIKAKEEEYDGEDKKTAGTPYILEGGEKVPTTHNPTHVDWTVRVNDDMGDYENAKVVDDLHENLKIVEGSIKVYRIIRNYKNEEIGREEVIVTPSYTANGFELDLGSISDAYEITYTTELIRPEGGGALEINNAARIILDGDETEVNDSTSVTWSGDLPAITKDGKLSTQQGDIIDWTVFYNLSRLDLGEVTLTDTLSHGHIILDSIEVYTVDVDEEGNTSNPQPVTVTPVLDTDGNLTFPGLETDGKAYMILFSSTVPFGLNGTVVNTITDDLDQPNSDSDSIPVNTIPDGGKVGEQFVDEDGRPYIEWTITLNSNKIDVGSITIRDVFDQLYLDFDVTDSSLYELYKDGVPATNFSIGGYTHTDGREGFILNITDAGPHTYKFVYRTYYTVEGMKEPDLANSAELVFLPGEGSEVGPGIDPGTGIETPPMTYELTGPKAGIEKWGQYVHGDDDTYQVISWTVEFNESRILLHNPLLKEVFTSGNFSLVPGSVVLTADGAAFSNYTLSPNANGFDIQIHGDVKAKFVLTFKTTTDDTNNGEHVNEAILSWQGGQEIDDWTLDPRHIEGSKSGEVVINPDGSKSINWTIDLNTMGHVITNFHLVDTHTPNTLIISDIKFFRDGVELPASAYTLTGPANGQFEIHMARKDPVPYKLTYTTTLSPEEEMSEVKNVAAITYTGGSATLDDTILPPTLAVSKAAVKLNKTVDPAVISWRITANTDSANKFVNLVDAVLEDTIPGDQKLVAGSIKVYRTDNPTVDLASGLAITSSDNAFSIGLPDGPYRYYVDFQTEILEYPSFDGTVLDRYNNSTVLTNQTKNEDLTQSDSATARIRYFGSGGGNASIKSGVQNPDTENVDWSITVNPEGLTIHNTVIKDTLSAKHSYVDGSFRVMDKDGLDLDAAGYTLTVAADKRSFELVIGDGTITEPYRISYSTRLDAHLVGNHTISNSIELYGGQEEKLLDRTSSTTTAQQWFFGGGGEGRTVDFVLNKVTPLGSSLAEAEFRLDRFDLNGSIVEVDADITTDENGIYLSGDIRAGRYRLTETQAPQGYLLATPLYFTIGYAPAGSDSDYIVTVTSASWQPGTHPNVTVDGNEITFRNDYEAVEADLEAHKQLTGQTLSEGQFSFRLRDENGTLLQTVANDIDGQAHFLPLSLNEVGTHTFTIEEVQGSLGGITYDTTVYTVEIVVVEGDEGLEIESITYLDDEDEPVPGAVFNNSYAAAATSAVMEAVKNLTGQTLAAGQFSFELLDEDGDLIETVTNGADGQVYFTAISYTETGVHEYTIREFTGSQGGVTYDLAVYTATVTVTDDGAGQLHTAIAYNSQDGQAPIFRNSYAAAATDAVIEVGKSLTGQALRDGQFSFELLDGEGTLIETVDNDADGRAVFSALDFDSVGTYTFTVREVQGSLGGITYDTGSYTVQVVVTDDGVGQLHAEVVYPGVGGIPVFENSYSAASSEAILQATKSLSGQELSSGQFSFELLDEEGNILYSVVNTASGQVVFPAINYTDPGVYDYTIRETVGSQGGVTYDTSSYPVTVTVTDDGEGQLHTAISYETPEGQPPVFTNSYATQAAETVIEAGKILTGQTLTEDQFLFELVDEEGNIVASTGNNADGRVRFEGLAYDETGVYTYTLREVEGSQGGVVYDTSTYQVTVTVTDDGVGQLHAEVAYESEGGAAPVFLNSYSAEAAEFELEVGKILTGQSLRDGQFSFELVDEEGEVIRTAVNTADGRVVFPAITYMEPGVYSYFVREVEGSQGGVTYDSTVMAVTVQVFDNGEGQIVAEPDFGDTEAVFVNSYAAKAIQIQLEARKTLKGMTLTAGQFEFELLDSEGELLETVTNLADGRILFSGLVYTEAGTHSYFLREVQGDEKDMVYDENEYSILVTVTDDGEGNLAASISGGPVTFVNEYSKTGGAPVTGESNMLLLQGILLLLIGSGLGILGLRGTRRTKEEEILG